MYVRTYVPKLECAGIKQEKTKTKLTGIGI